MITTEQKKQLMRYLNYEYIPFNSEKHQLKDFFNHGYWFKYPPFKKKLETANLLPATRTSHSFYYNSKLWGGSSCVVKNLWDFNDWNQIMQVVRKMNEEDLIWKSNEKGYDFPDRLATGQMDYVLECMLEILNDFSVI